MFFLGVSAHMFMYLLFPALIVIWLYFKGVAGHSEISSLVPEKVECACSYYPTVDLMKKSVYQIRKQLQYPQKKERVTHERAVRIAYFPLLPQSPTLKNSSRRAPPFLL